MLPVHDEVASVVSLARTVLSGVDRRRFTTEVQTESLILLLNTLVALATPSVHQKVDDAAGRTIKQLVASVETAIHDRDDTGDRQRTIRRA